MTIPAATEEGTPLDACRQDAQEPEKGNERENGKGSKETDGIIRTVWLAQSLLNIVKIKGLLRVDFLNDSVN